MSYAVAGLAAGTAMVLLGSLSDGETRMAHKRVSLGIMVSLLCGYLILADSIPPMSAMFCFVLLIGVLAAWARTPLADKIGPRTKIAMGISREILPVLVVVYLFRQFGFEPYQIPSSSMKPGLEIGDVVLVNKFAYGLREPVRNTSMMTTGVVQRGDVAVFQFPLRPEISYVKRVIGLPGDVVTYQDKHLSINGAQVIQLSRGSYQFTEASGTTFQAKRWQEALAGKNYEVLTMDGFPPVDQTERVSFAGREACKYDDHGFTCRVPQGHYLMLGDNRDDSFDGRYWGFVPESNLEGRAIRVLFNTNHINRFWRPL